MKINVLSIEDSRKMVYLQIVLAVPFNRSRSPLSNDLSLTLRSFLENDEAEQFKLVEAERDPEADRTIVKAKYVCIHSKIQGAISQQYSNWEMMSRIVGKVKQNYI